VTLVPKTNRLKNSKLLESKRIASEDHFLDLYKRSKPAKARRDKSPDDFEFEKSAGECTFKPNITRSVHDKGALLDKSATQEIKGMSKLLERMNKGRQDAEVRKQITERGPI